jgi:hypothetical protein
LILYKINVITSTEIEEIYEPLEEGLVKVVENKRLSLLLIKLTLKPEDADLKSVGYLPPLDSSEVKESIIIKIYIIKDNQEENVRIEVILL